MVIGLERIQFMTVIKLVSEKEAKGQVKEIYEDIKSFYELDFVPKVFQAWANNPEKLAAKWRATKDVQQKMGKEKFHIIGLSTSLQTGCDYCINFHTRILQDEGYTDQDLGFLIETISGMVASDLFVQGMQLEPDVKPIRLRLEEAA